jgi:hypothetical protein
MKERKILAMLMLVSLIIVLTSSMIFASTNTSDYYKERLNYKKCVNMAIADKNACLSDAKKAYHDCCSGTEYNYYEKGMDFWKFRANCIKEILRPKQQVCKSDYNLNRLICKTSPAPQNSTQNFTIITNTTDENFSIDYPTQNSTHNSTILIQNRTYHLIHTE